MNLSPEAQKFLWYSLFSKSYDKLAGDHDYALKICARRAYRDMNRTLKFYSNKNKQKDFQDEVFAHNAYRDKNQTLKDASDKKKREDFRDEICAIIITGIEKLLMCCDKAEFDCKHSEICTEIIAAAKDANILKQRNNCEEVFYYGQAQKWLNMTMKYMRIMGFWTDELKPLGSYLHVPVDNIIMQEASDIGVKLPRTDGSSGKYSDATLPWSKWESDNYKTFQNELQSRLKEVSPQELPMEWESRVWAGAEKDEM